MALMNGAQFVARTLDAYRVSHVFFVPAVLTPALAEMERVGVRPVMAHSEKAAAYMADGYARAQRGPGVCLGQSVGAANLAAGLQDAFLGLSPVIAITGRRPPPWRHRHSYQEIDHGPMFEPVTKFSAQVDRIEELPVLMRQAFRSAMSGAPAPTHLDLAGIAGDQIINAEADLEVIAEPRFSRLPPFRPRPDPADVAAVATMLAEAERPAIVAGGGVAASGAAAELETLVDKLRVPFAYALNAKGQIADGHPLNVGVVGSYSRSSANKAIAEADAVLFVGSRTGSQATHDWRIPRPGTKVAQIDIDAEELGRNYPNTASVLGDVRESLRELLDAVEPVSSREAWLGRVREIVGEWTAEYRPQWESDAVPLRPERVCKEVAAALPADAVVVCDTGHSAMWAGMYMDIDEPGQRFLRCAGSLGWAFPAAIGVQCALADQPVVCFTGDGGLWYHIGEVETAVAHGLPVVTVVNDNGSLNQTRGGVERAYADGHGDPDRIWRFTDVDLAALARDMGASGYLVTKPGELQGAIAAALEARRPAIIDVKTDAAAMAPLPWG